MPILTFLLFFSSVSFLFFGVSCLFAPFMKAEFTRYGLVKWRILVGTLQLAGAFGLVIGYFQSPFFSAISAMGLSILMFLGFAVRLKIKDNLLQSAPSLIYAILNGYIAATLFSHINMV